MDRCDDKSAPEVYASAILREVPLHQLGHFLDRLSAGSGSGCGGAGDGCGSNCGNGCGAGCGSTCGFAIDRFGYTGLTAKQIADAVKDKNGLKDRLRNEVRNSLRTI